MCEAVPIHATTHDPALVWSSVLIAERSKGGGSETFALKSKINKLNFNAVSTGDRIEGASCTRI